MAQVRKISGFPEWLPEQRIVEEAIIGKIRALYQSFGFIPVETSAVELLSTLEKKGAVDKEIFLLRRTHEEDAGEDPLALHFDLTVPLARCVAQNFNTLVFPFRRYQLQKVWRGERPQQGRYREFCQFDADIVASEHLPVSCDAEVLTLFEQVFSSLEFVKFKISINNRKVLQGFYEGLGIGADQRKAVLIAVDKLDKIGREGVDRELAALEVEPSARERILNLATVRAHPAETRDQLEALGVKNDIFQEGLNELLEVFRLVPQRAHENLLLDLSLARGLDYYTGSIFEVRLPEHPEFGSAGSGGRYDNLCGDFLNRSLPGVGVSVGITRLMGLAFHKGLLPTGKQGTARALVTVYTEDQRVECNELAAELRSYGVPTEVFFRSPKLGKQIDYASKKGIQFVVFKDAESGQVSVKDLATGVQQDLDDVAQWCAQVNS